MFLDIHKDRFQRAYRYTSRVHPKDLLVSKLFGCIETITLEAKGYIKVLRASFGKIVTPIQKITLEPHPAEALL
jgi:hypothetical protein